MKILSDFDGVWTDQTAEIAAIRGSFLDAVATRLAQPRPEVESAFRAFYQETLAAPHENGWFPNGHLAAFVDEDELLCTASVGAYLDRGLGDTEGDRWRAAIVGEEFPTVADFVNPTFRDGMLAARANGHGLVPEAKGWLADLRKRDVDLVIVSNSPPEKLHALFAAIGAEEGERLRFVGGAAKWWIEDARDRDQVGGRDVLFDRRRYRDILAAERPDVVVGDVMSLDLALPARMRARGELSSDLKLVLRASERTPAWSRELLDERGSPVDAIAEPAASPF